MRAQPVGGFAQTVEFTILDPLEEAGPAVDLTLVEAVGPPEVGQPLGFPVHLRQQCNALGQLVTQIRTGVQLTVERLGPHPVLIHRGPSVDEAHQIERATEHRRVVAYTDGGRVRNLGAVERLDDAPLAQNPLVPVRRGTRRWHADDAALVAPGELVDHVLRAAGQKPRGQRLPRARQRRTVHPLGEAVDVDAGADADVRSSGGCGRFGHRLPTSSSRYSANLALAASRLRGSHSDGQTSSLAL
ncbi:MAG: hypothetical protein QOF25_2124 [Mycobacterium sp.]|nr:hypothetical protein [Mycobacterium sp.]